MIYATDGLVDALLSFAREKDPEAVTVELAMTAAGDLEGATAPDLEPTTPVFSHFYFPGAGESVRAVFGVDLGTPAGRTQGRFLSHPDGRLEVTQTDDLHAVVFVAVPPWDRDSVAAFDRAGRRQRLVLLDAEPPEERIP